MALQRHARRLRRLYVLLVAPACYILLRTLLLREFTRLLQLVPLFGLLGLSVSKLSRENALDYCCRSQLWLHGLSTLAICAFIVLSSLDGIRERSWIGAAEVAILAPEVWELQALDGSSDRSWKSRLRLPFFYLWLGTGAALCIASMRWPERLEVAIDEWGVVSLMVEKIILGSFGDHEQHCEESARRDPARQRSSPF
eukprot:TRINITY_DN97432_c0_g1_i1.p1 TRINITY_DN97432_c0_g1~~TRINITY_DN97432_c0_g1_i1.p1  ORF type:complete len:198 (+),score=35.21 TRINITY_DN97432_c0_g1_i1:77-670(+)